MCSRFSLAHRIALAAKWKRVKNPRNLPLDQPFGYNIAPTDPALVITHENNTLQFDQMIFGMIPHWAKDAKMGLNCINARSETITEKPSFRKPFKEKRCLVPADGFFEWDRSGKTKVPHRFTVKGQEIFSLAGLWDEWTSPFGKTVHSFAIITTDPNPLVASIHDRMPVIIKPEDEEKWLTAPPEEAASLVSLLKRYDGPMENFLVTPKMNSSRYKEPDAITRLL